MAASMFRRASASLRNSLIQTAVRGFSGSASHQVLVVGGGPGGLSVASSLLRKGIDVGIVEPSGSHYYQPGWTLVGGGIKSLDCTRRDMSDVMPGGAKWYRESVEAFDPENNRVTTDDGTEIKYRALVVAVGIDIKWDKIKGLPEALNQQCGVSSNYSAKTAPLTWKLIQAMEKGTAIFTFPSTPIKCAGAPQKIMYLADDYWRKMGRRDAIDIQFRSAVGKIFAVEKYGNALNKVCDEKEIPRHFGSDLIEVRGKDKEAVFKLNPDICGKDGIEVVKYDFMHATPMMGPYDVVKNSALADAVGWVEVNKDKLQHVRFPNVFSLGDCSSLPTSKTAAAITDQSRVLKANLEAFLQERELTETYCGYTSCPLPVGDEKLILAEFDYNGQPLETFFFDQSNPTSFAYTLKKEVMPRMYWDGLLKGYWEGPGQARKLTNPFNS